MLSKRYTILLRIETALTLLKARHKDCTVCVRPEFLENPLDMRGCGFVIIYVQQGSVTYQGGFKAFSNYT